MRSRDADGPSHVLITGASGGIGLALALAYAAPGIVLSLAGRDPARLEQVAERCRARGASVQTIALDVRDREALMAWVRARDDLHPVDRVIANAGVASTQTPTGPGEGWAEIEAVMEVNLLGALATIHPLADRMAERGRGRIGLMSSLGAYAGMPISPAYNASKAALKIYGEGLRGWLAPRGVGVTVICPGFVDSAMSQRYPGPMPFKWSAEKAAARIREGLERNRAVVAFPWPLGLAMRLLGWLPTDWSLALQRLFRY